MLKEVKTKDIIEVKTKDIDRVKQRKRKRWKMLPINEEKAEFMIKIKTKDKRGENKVYN